MSATAHRVRRSVGFGLGILLVGLGAGTGWAADQKQRPEQRTEAAKAASPAGTLLQHANGQPAWQVVRPQQPVFSTDELLAWPGDQAKVEAKNGAVQLTLWGNLPEFSSFPVLESAVVLHTDPNIDLDFTLKRGRVVVRNRANRVPARVRIRFDGQTWTLALQEAGTEVAVERYGRWVAGSRFVARPGPEDMPSAAVVLFVLKGQADLQTVEAQYRMAAPPGPAYFHWNNVSGTDRGTSRREKIPLWAEKGPRQTPEAQALYKAVEEQRRSLAEKPVEAALMDGLHQSDPARRQVAVDTLAAVDDLPRLADALGHETNADVRDAAVPVLQHWIGRGPGQDTKLYQFLIQQRQFTPRQAETALQLLHDFSIDDRDRPETYETLIGYLRHPQPAIRELAKWYLYRLVPAGRNIAYDPAGPEAQRERAYKEWKQLIPNGKLPPKGR